MEVSLEMGPWTPYSWDTLGSPPVLPTLYLVISPLQILAHSDGLRDPEDNSV